MTMANLEAMIRAVDFIEANLRADISVADIAGAVSYSLFHFCRVFSKVIQHTPYDYLMRRRLSEAAKELLETDKRVIEIALDYQFNNPETFSRAFKRMFGMQPIQWRERRELNNRRLLPRLTAETIERTNEMKLSFPAIVQREELVLSGLMTLAVEGQGTEGQLWEILEQELRLLSLENPPGLFYGIYTYPQAWKEKRTLYFAAFEAGPVVDGIWVQKRLPASRYIRFAYHGRREDRSSHAQ